MVTLAATRVFRGALPGARVRLVGGDSGQVEHEQFVDGVALAPSERVTSRRSRRRPDVGLLSLRPAEANAKPEAHYVDRDDFRLGADIDARRRRLSQGTITARRDQRSIVKGERPCVPTT